MRAYYTVDQVRAAEAELFTRVAAGVPMRRAAHGLARVVAEELRVRTGAVYGRAVALLVGSGDNGGDALWAGSMLRRRGVAVSAVLLDPERAHAEGLAALLAAGGRIVAEPGAPDLVVDGIVGLSGRGPLRPRAAEIVAGVCVPIVAVDLPSGVDPDTGAVEGPAVTADVTVAFGAYKPVHALAAPRCGRIELVPIGLRLPAADLIALDPAEVGAGWPVPRPDDDKYTQGVTGISAGSVTYPGAAVLCTGAAVAATSGMVRYAGTADVLSHWPEVIAASSVSDAGRVQAWAVGPGGGIGGAAEAHLRQVLAEDVPVVVDADGLTLLGADPALTAGRRSPTVLTPHDREFARLAGQEPGADRVAAVRQLAERYQATVLLKGYATLIAAPGRPVLVNVAGGAWAATAGSGDVLSGVIGALLAAGCDPCWAAAAAARAHALAASLAAGADPLRPASRTRALAAGGAAVSASMLIEHLRPAIRTLRSMAAAVAGDGVPGTAECCISVAGWQDREL